MKISKTLVLLIICITQLFLITSAFAVSEEEKTFLSMYFKDDELVVLSATRSLKAITRVAENIEVVTKKDIELMNAHTLADVLNTVNGIQQSFIGAGPGSGASIFIQGSSAYHVLVLIDGVSINDIAGGFADPGIIPANMIEKIEVIKGPASSVWGSSLGGVVNVITKTPPMSDKIKGTLSGSYGERNTGDFSAELSGRKDKLGYYFFADRLQTDGLRTHDKSHHDSLYTKFSYDLLKDTQATFTLLYTKDKLAQGDFESRDMRFESKDEYLLSTLAVRSKLNDALSIDLSARAYQKKSGGTFEKILEGTVTDSALKDNKYGTSAKAEFRQGPHLIVAGTDIDLLYATADFLGGKIDERIVALYANDTISLGRLTLIPGLRFDSIKIKDTSLDKNAISPSLGATYELADKTLLRAYVAKGFNIPGVSYLVSNDQVFFRKNPDLTIEKVWSYQIGLETGALNYFWLKVSGFRHDISDAIVEKDFYDDNGTWIGWTNVNTARARRQGFELALKTQSFNNFTLSAATSYANSKDFETGESYPLYTYDLGLQYDDKNSFRAVLKGRHIWWSSSDYYNGSYSSFVLDFNAIKTLCKSSAYNVEAFLTGHNLFNGSQYAIAQYKNARRWLEAGIRVKF